MNGNLGGQRIAIIGGGLIGLFSAHYLIRQGAEVVIMERKRLGSGAARGNGGLIVWTECTPLAGPGVIRHMLRKLFSSTSPLFLKPSALMRNAIFFLEFARHCSADAFSSGLARLDYLSVRTQRLYRELKQDGIALGVSEAGILRVFRSRKAADEDRTQFEQLASRGLGLRPGLMMRGDELHAFEPALSSGVECGFMQQGEAFTDPSIVVDKLIASLLAHGVEVREDTAAADVIEDRHGVRVLSDHGEVRADKCLIATGAWSRELAAKLGLRLILAAGKGYSFSVRPAITPKRAIAFADSHAGATPLGDGRLRLAGMMEFDGTYENFNLNRVDAIKASASPYLIGVDWTQSSEEWVAPRPMTPDGAPYIGKIPGKSATFIATGHNMLGLSLGPSTGEVVAEMMSGVADPVLLEALSPTR
jgi:D-amino-acid dehydrogenase